MRVKKIKIQDQYNHFLNIFLEERLFAAGFEIHNELVEVFKVSAENARKITGRAVAQKVIKSSKPYTFGKGQYVYIYNDYIFDKEGIKAVTEKSRPPIYRLLEMMDQNDGIISYYEALKITAAPLEESSTKVSSLEDIVTLLMKFDILYKKKDHNEVVYLVYKYEKQELPEMEVMALMSVHYSKMVADCSVLPDILRWLGRINLLNTSNIIYRNKKTPHIGASHNNLTWDAFAYTSTTGVNDVLGAKADTIEKQTLVVLDMVLSAEYSALHFDAFLARIQINLNAVSEGKRKILPIVVYKTCSEYTFNVMRKNGILAFDVASIFGTKIYDVLERMAGLADVSFGNEHIDGDIEKILNTISNAGQNEALKDLRGTLFEYLMYPLLTSFYPNARIFRGKILEKINEQGEKEKHEYDYIIESNNPNERILVELKGYQGGARINTGNKDEKASLKWFYRRSLPFAEKYFKGKSLDNIPVKAVFITSAGFYDDGKEFLDKMDKSKYKPARLNCGYDRELLLKLLEENSFQNEVRIIKKFYAKNEKPDEFQESESHSSRNILDDI